jgi:ribosomal protein S18 acetylase RimI-like enzyme
VRLRRANEADRDFLAQMIVHAAFRPGHIPPLEEAVRAPHVVPWLDGWMRTGDVGVVAEDDGGALGAAWCRRFTGDEVGISGFVDSATPVLSIGVAEGQRGRGIGAALLEQLVAAARAAGCAALSLSVGRSNPALRLYERLGWQRLADASERHLRLSRPL